MKQTIYEMGLDQTPANFVALTPVTFMARTAQIYPGRAATVYNDLRRSWAETYERCRRFACALVQRGVGQGDTVSIMATNIPEMFEAHFAVPMSGAVLNAINTRLDAGSVAFILNHAETKVFIVDPELAEVAAKAVKLTGRADILVIDIIDESFGQAVRIGARTYDELLDEDDPDFVWAPPSSEWDAISLNYTSGTTGDPKGVVYYCRGGCTHSRVSRGGHETRGNGCRPYSDNPRTYGSHRNDTGRLRYHRVERGIRGAGGQSDSSHG